MASIDVICENHLFAKVYAKGKRASTKNVVVYALNNFKTPSTRLGITTGKKIGGAVSRSRARRLIREAYRAITAQKEWKRPYLIVIVARGAITDKKRKMGEVQSDLEKAFHALGLFRETNT